MLLDQAESKEIYNKVLRNPIKMSHRVVHVFFYLQYAK